jgi:ribosomal protein S27AE
MLKFDPTANVWPRARRPQFGLFGLLPDPLHATVVRGTARDPETGHPLREAMALDCGPDDRHACPRCTSVFYPEECPELVAHAADLSDQGCAEITAAEVTGHADCPACGAGLYLTRDDHDRRIAREQLSAADRAYLARQPRA